MSVFFFISMISSILLGWSYGCLYLIVRLFPILSRHQSLIIWCGMILTLMFIIGITLANIYPSRISSIIYMIGSIWIGALGIAGFLAVVLLIIASIGGWTYTHVGVCIGFVLTVIMINIYGLIMSWSPRIISYDISLHGDHEWHGRTIAMIADTHYGNIYDDRDARRLVERLNTLHPDIVIIPGDFFDGPVIDFESIVREFDYLEAPYGALFANGNHEEYRNTPMMLESMSGSRIEIINDRKKEIKGVVFAGVTYHSVEQSDGLRTALDALSLEDTKPTILLKHKPTLHETLREYPIDLVVSGHTHRGQMWPFNYLTDWIYGAYVYGMVEQGSLTSITTSGVGSWGPPQRIGTRSEIVLIHVR